MGLGAGVLSLPAQFCFSLCNHFQEMRRWVQASPPARSHSTMAGLRLLTLELVSSFTEKLFLVEKNQSTCPVKAMCPAEAWGRGNEGTNQGSSSQDFSSLVLFCPSSPGLHYFSVPVLTDLQLPGEKQACKGGLCLVWNCLVLYLENWTFYKLFLF